jgi:ferritin-like metal-binding protein YciE
MTIRTLDELFVHGLKDLYDAEQQLTKAMPTMLMEITSPDLKAAVEEHLHQTQQHIKRLERVFESVGKTASRRVCPAMRGILDEGEDLLEEVSGRAVRDAAIIAIAQRVEHYEMAGYGTARTYAYLLGYTQAAQLLQETLDEEENTDKTLTQLANNLNILAIE